MSDPRALEPPSLESALVETGQQLDAALRAAATLTRELKKARAAATTGSLRDLRRSLAATDVLADQSAVATAAATTSFTLDEAAHLASGAFAAELLALAADRDVVMVESDDRLLCYPSLIRVVAGDAAVEIDRTRERRLRPSLLIDRLAAAQSRPPRFRPEPFLESLAAGYRLLLAQDDRAPGTVLRLVDLWSVLTLLPGQAREYTRPELARDLYLLDQSATTTTRSGATLRFHASTGTKGAGVLTTVARDGRQKLYWGISFTEGA
ncbi:hypothetical protein RHODO2019_17510 [Rhodococcus antarcticus]|uniref:Uncharacterized protein n=1 Tax=Rhodococcus antarcticus TaxID=2987751 RepID=A0ABY6NZS9_9NOCA|nr:hypothetical protein [Rhodococcus antarcticus]UZJ24871.1 hypothetical protein RHODO2019_17510 [Rhodococcus antarcticus]